jgi:hypothetical protein
MKYLRIFESWISNEDQMIDENMQAAKSFMLKRLADRLRKPVQELSPEEQAQALSDPKYKEIIDLLGEKYRGYAGSFVNFVFLQRISIEQLQLLLTKIADNREFINSLPHTVEEYSKGNPDQAARISGYEALMDQFAQIEFRRKGKWLIDKLPRAIRDKARAATPEEQQALFRLGANLANEDPEIQKRLMKKVNRFLDKPIAAFIQYATNFADAQNIEGGAIKLAAQAEELAPAVNVMYDDDRYVVMSIRTEAAQKALCSAANWCINTWAWKQYATGAVQINIFDFGVPTTDPLHIVGTTIYYNGNVRTSHDINDIAIKKSDDPAEHFTKLGYPAEVVDSIVKPLSAECAVKQVLDEGASAKTGRAIIDKIMTAGHSLQIADQSMSTYAEQEIVNVVDQEMGQLIKMQDVVDSFKQFGVLSTFAAKLYNKLIVGSAVSEADSEAILAKTARGFKLMETAIAAGTFDKQANTKRKIEAILAVKDQILTMISGQ